MKSPAFSLYVRDFLSSPRVSKLHSKSRSTNGSNMAGRCFNAYVFLLFRSWLQTPRATLPTDDEELAELAQVSREEWIAIKPLVMDLFLPYTGGRIYNDRLMFESEKQRVRGEAGSKGGNKKQANRLAKDVAKTEANHLSTLEDANEVAISQSGGCGGRPKSEDEVIAHGSSCDPEIDEETCRAFFQYYEAIAEKAEDGTKFWVMKNGGRITDWKTKMRGFKKIINGNPRATIDPAYEFSKDE
jgi:uncharacterized protein YdaU (DUF1376 family)